MIPEPIVVGHLRLEFDPGEHDSLTCALVNERTGERREQTVRPPFNRGWRDTTMRRMSRMDEDAMTPIVLIPGS